MCDFWVSQARHYCNYCKVWTSGSKESVRRHEEGARHKDRVAQILKKKRQGPRVPADARNLQKQLADIEAAAAASMGASARGERGAFAGALNAGGLNVSAPAGRGGRPTTWPGMGEAGGHRAPPPREWTGPTWQMPRSADDAEAMEDQRPAGAAAAGEYTVRGALPAHFWASESVSLAPRRVALSCQLQPRCNRAVRRASAQAYSTLRANDTQTSSGREESARFGWSPRTRGSPRPSSKSSATPRAPRAARRARTTFGSSRATRLRPACHPHPDRRWPPRPSAGSRGTQRPPELRRRRR